MRDSGATVVETVSRRRSMIQKPPAQSGDDTNKDLVKFLGTRDGLAHMTGAILTQHINLYTRLDLTAADLDTLFLSLEHVTTWEETCFHTFLYEYEQLFSDLHKDTVSGEIECKHSPVIHLLTDLLKLSLEPIEYNTLWLRILAGLASRSRTLAPLVRYKTAAAILGCMAARGDVIEVQEYGCQTLAVIAEYGPPQTQKGPLREGGVQLITLALQTHPSLTAVVYHALVCLGNLTQTYARMAMETVNSMELVGHLEQQRDALVRIMEVLDFIEETAVPVVTSLPEKYQASEEIQMHIQRILSYFCHGQQQILKDPRTQVVSGDLDLQENEGQQHFDQTSDLTRLVEELNRHPLPQMQSRGPCDVTNTKQHPSASETGPTTTRNGTSTTRHSTNHRPQNNTRSHGNARSSPEAMMDAVEFFPEEELETEQTEDNQVYKRRHRQAVQCAIPKVPSPIEEMDEHLDSSDFAVSPPPDFDDVQQEKPNSVANEAFQPNYKVYVNPARKKEGSLLEKFKRRKKPVPLSTEYNPSSTTSNPEPEYADSGNKLYGFLDRPETQHEPGVTTGTGFDSPPPSNNDNTYQQIDDIYYDKRTSPNEAKTSTISRYAKIFNRLGKKKKKPKNDNGSNSPDATKQTKNKDKPPPDILADFVRKTRTLLREGKGKYDVTEAASKTGSTLTESRVSGVSYLPVTLEGHGHILSLDLQNSMAGLQQGFDGGMTTGSGQQEVLY